MNLQKLMLTALLMISCAACAMDDVDTSTNNSDSTNLISTGPSSDSSPNN